MSTDQVIKKPEKINARPTSHALFWGQQTNPKLKLVKGGK